MNWKRSTFVVGALGAVLSTVVLMNGNRPAVREVAAVETAAARPERPDSPPPVPAPAPSVPPSTPALPPVTSPKRSRPVQQPDTMRARYPKEWEVSIPAGTRLDSLRRSLDSQIAILPARDLEDQSPLPIWFRVFLRKQNRELPTQGPYQYPRAARNLLRWMIAHPDSVTQ